MQVSSLIYPVGSEAEYIYKSFAFAVEGDKSKYESFLKKFEHFVFKRNVIH